MTGLTKLPRGVAAVAVLAALLLAVPASAQSTPIPTLHGDQRLTLNLQAPVLGVQVPLEFVNGDPESWTIAVYVPGHPPGDTDPGEPEKELARLSGTGAVRDPLVPVTDPEWRWKLLHSADLVVTLRVTSTAGGQSLQSELTPGLRMYTDRGPYWSDASNLLPGHFPIYPGPGLLQAPIDPYLIAFGKLVHAQTSSSTFLRRGRLRKTVSISYVVPYKRADSVRLRVVRPGRRGTLYGTTVYQGTSRKTAGMGDGTRVAVTGRLTKAGRRAASSKAGARKLAATLAQHGVVRFEVQSPADGGTQDILEVPMGTCFKDPFRPKQHPCAQTCPPFPNMPTGYLLYTSIGFVWGSSTCTKGDPLPPIPS